MSARPPGGGGSVVEPSDDEDPPVDALPAEDEDAAPEFDPVDEPALSCEEPSGGSCSVVAGLEQASTAADAISVNEARRGVVDFTPPA